VSLKDREIWLVAEPTELAQTRRLADEAAASYGLREPERFDFAFAVNEAVSNAIEHGSPSPDGTIQIRFSEEGDALVFRVRDYGEFAAREKLYEDPSSRGRGLALMATMVEELRLCRGSTGTLVRLAKRRGTPDPRPSWAGSEGRRRESQTSASPPAPG
jgi:anti-sigma regulatory factor (Ser/Thr protein kinase)